MEYSLYYAEIDVFDGRQAQRGYTVRPDGTCEDGLILVESGFNSQAEAHQRGAELSDPKRWKVGKPFRDFINSMVMP